MAPMALLLVVSGFLRHQVLLQRHNKFPNIRNACLLVSGTRSIIGQFKVAQEIGSKDSLLGQLIHSDT